MSMLVVTIFSAAAAANLSALLFRIPSMSTLRAFMWSLLSVVLSGIAMSARKAAIAKGESRFVTLLATVVTVACLIPGWQPYLSAWHAQHDRWVLYWIAFLALMVVWVPSATAKDIQGT